MHVSSSDSFFHEDASVEAAQIHAAASSPASMASGTVGLRFDTLPALLSYVAESYHKANALNYPCEGSWLSYSHAKFRERVMHLALGLVDLGLRRGETVGVIAPSSPDWIIIDLAIQFAGGITVPIFNKISVESFTHEVTDSGMRILFVGDAEEMPKAHDHAGSQVHLISFGYSGEHLFFDELAERGERLERSQPRLFEELGDRVRPDDLATIIYTSGSTGLPKGVELTQRALVIQVKDTDARFPRDPESDVCLSLLPLAHVFQRTVSYFHIASGLPIYFAADPKLLSSYLAELHPSILTVVPRVLEKLHTGIVDAVEDYPLLKRRIARAAIRRAESKEIEPAPSNPLDAFYRRAVYDRMTAALGGNLRYVICGSSKLDPKLARFFINIGVPIYEGYGLTEAAPVITANGPARRKLGTVGRAFDSVELRLSEAGEILARGPNVMRGYHNLPEATAEAIDPEGWLHTGDLGSLDEEGYLIITGRKKELFKKSTGEYVPPAPIEHALEGIPFVEAAVIFADNRVYVTAILFPDLEGLSRFKARHGLEEMRDDEFLRSEFLYARTQELVTEINRHRHHCEWVERFYIADHPATMESGELTPTLKVRRHFIEEKYADVIEQMYASIGGTK